MRLHKANHIRSIGLHFMRDPLARINFVDGIIPCTPTILQDMIERDLLAIHYMGSLTKDIVQYQLILYNPDGTRRCVSKRVEIDI